MKAAIYSPYFDTLGGGERYVLSVAKILSEDGWKVDVQITAGLLEKAAKRFGMNLSKINIVDDIKRGDKYDLCFWLSDGSIPNLLARKNILHFQRPFFGVDGKSLLNRMKFFRVSKAVVNSQFTKSWIDKEYPVESTVIYPPVDIKNFKPGKKEKLILSVGRFSELEQAKRQDILVNAFKSLFDSGNKEWELILTGGSLVGRTNFIEKLKRASDSYPIKIIENPKFEELKGLYSQASIYWSAAGYGVDANSEPNRLEHFGISVVEGMASGAVPVVFNGGGHTEIVENGANGFLWDSTQELKSKTQALVKDVNLRQQLAARAKSDAKQYAFERFKKEFLALL